MPAELITKQPNTGEQQTVKVYPLDTAQKAAQLILTNREEYDKLPDSYEMTVTDARQLADDVKTQSNQVKHLARRN